MAKKGNSDGIKEYLGAFPGTFTNRGPNKRKVKPTLESQLIQFSMIASDSEDDEDFVANSGDEEDFSSEHSEDGAQQDEAQSSNSDEEDVEDGGGRSTVTLGSLLSKIQEESTSDSEEEGGEEEDDDAQEVTTKTEKEIKLELEIDTENSAKPKKSRLRQVCGICLESISTEQDELVGCDGCGITVHEGCYGDAEDSVEEDKSDSDADTEPWFCDACKANAEGFCELCPVKGGILKQTDTGSWVHLICALYVPGVGFRDVDKLQTVVLDDITPSRWGSRQCKLCEDQRFSKTGICIECDAGLCKTYFHASCAQMNGLLTEIPPAGHLDDNDADPLYAHCRMHSDKTVVKARINSWLAFQSHFKNFKQSDDPEEKARIENAFQKEREEYREARRNQFPAVIKTYEEPRLLSTCPEVCSKLLKKAELLGFSSSSQEIFVAPNTSGPASRPAFSCEYVSHFFKRETLITEFNANEEPFKQSIKMNTVEQKKLQENLGTLKKDLEVLKSSRQDVFSKVSSLHEALEKLIGKKLSLPDVLRAKKKARKVSETLLETIIHICATCNGTENQHLMALCDTCHNYYHIGCLDPPLTSLPRKGHRWLWQCTECDESESSDESIDEDGPAKRKRKRQRVAPQKFTPTEETKTKKKKSHHGHKIGRPRKETKKEIHVIDVDDDSRDGEILKVVERSAPVRKPRPTGRKKKVPVEVKFDPCHVCSKEGEIKNMVRCDECSQCYHFDCCEPKLKANPKRRGYLWICNECDDSEEDEDEDEMEEVDGVADCDNKGENTPTDTASVLQEVLET